MTRITSQPTRPFRTPVRCAAFLAAVVLLLPLFPSPQVASTVPAASPFVMLATSLATHSVGLAAIVGLPIFVLALFRRRCFCRWACPLGLMTEGAGRISPISSRRCKPVPPVGRWILLLSLAAATVGYPLFLWLDPLAVFSGTMGLATAYSSLAARCAAVVLAAILVLSFVLPGAWCLKACPLGAMQDLLAAPRRWLRRRETADDPQPRGDELIVEPISRRNLLASAIGATCAAAGAPLGLAARASAEPGQDSVLRPPGAVAPWQFGQLCLRCGNCVRSCPAQIITTRWHSTSWANWLAPEVHFDSDYCREGCDDCIKACPSGALAKTSTGTKLEMPIGLAQVLMDRCLLALGRECRTMCLESCPYDAITLHEWTWEDDRRYPIVTAAKCPGCGACQVACTPMDAIAVRPGG